MAIIQPTPTDNKPNFKFKTKLNLGYSINKPTSDVIDNIKDRLNESNQPVPIYMLIELHHRYRTHDTLYGFILQRAILTNIETVTAPYEYDITVADDHSFHQCEEFIIESSIMTQSYSDSFEVVHISNDLSNMSDVFTNTVNTLIFREIDKLVKSIQQCQSVIETLENQISVLRNQIPVSIISKGAKLDKLNDSLKYKGRHFQDYNRTITATEQTLWRG